MHIVGGKGEEVVLDSTARSSRAAWQIHFHNEGGSTVTAGLGLTVDPGNGSQEDRLSAPLTNPIEDRGSVWSVEMMLDWNAEYGPLLGAGPAYYRYGFRQKPYAWMASVVGGFAPFGGNGRVRMLVDSRVLVPGASVVVNGMISGYEMSEYYGAGNETDRRGDVGIEYYRPRLRQYRLAGSISFPVATSFQVTLSGSANYVRALQMADRYASIVRPYGVDGLAFFGVGGRLAFDTRDIPANPQEGVLMQVGGMVYPASHGLSESFSKSHVDLRTFVGGKGTPALTLALRMLGEKSWGNVPFFELPALGGWHGLRGMSMARFAGDAIALGSMELRASLWNVNLFIPATMGIAGFVETGRVFVSGESSSLWHGSYGGSLWIAPWTRDNTIGLALAGSAEGVEFYLDVGLGF
jgi:hypothetical protein